MSADAKTLLGNIVESCQRIGQYVAGMSKDDFLRETLVQDAVLRRIEIIGEAV